ncbi:MAG TPA: sugar ABC transporter substrate-binding protein [Tissierellaceae bacterium]
MKRLLSVLLVLMLVLSFTACSNKSDSNAVNSNDNSSNSKGSSSEVANLNFMYWGSTVEKEAVQEAVERFNERYAGKIKVTAQHVPNENYTTKLNTMIASNQAPDVAYVGSAAAVEYAKKGDIIFIEDILGDDKSFLDEVLEQEKWIINGKVAFISTATECLMISYNKDVFDELGVPYPPDKAEDALTWDEFVDLCKSVTIDINGNNAHSPDFDPNNIKTYGVYIWYGFNTWYPLLASLGGDIFNEDYTNTTFNSPEMIELMEKIQELIYVHHCAPSPAIADTLSSQALQTGQIAMTFDGNWSLLDYYKGGYNIGVTMYPDLGNGPYTISAPGVTAIFSQTKHPQECLEFYKYFLDPETGATDLYKNGLWQPIFKKYYTDEEKIDFWVDNEAHPKEYRSVIVDNIFKNMLRLPQSYINDWGELVNVLTPAVESIFRGEKSPKEALDEAQRIVEENGLFKGRFDQ